MIQLYIEKKVSSKSNKEFTALYANMGYGNDIMLSIDQAIISQFADLKISELATLEKNKKIIVGKVTK